MAYLNTVQNQQNNEMGMNNPQQQPQAQPPEQEQPASSPQSGAITSAPAPAPAAQPQQTQQAPAPKVKAPSSGMSSFQQYQKANQGAAQNRLGQNVQGNLQKNAAQAQGALQRGQTNFQQLMEQGTLANRQNAVGDVTKAAGQARNIYTGDLAADKAAKQGMVQSSQARMAEIDQQKTTETQAIAQERAALAQQAQAEYQKQLAAAQKKYSDAALVNQNTPYDMQEALYGNGNAMQQARMAEVKAKNEYEALKKAGSISGFGREQEAALAQREQQLAYSDFQRAQASDQAAAAQKALDELNSRQFTSGVDADLQQRFADIINARYSGPQSLRETGAYDETLSRVNRAQDLATMAKTAGGREDLLAQLYGRPGTEYSRGMSRLDASLLNTNKNAMQSIQSEAQKLGGAREALSRANIETQLAGQNRAKEIADIRGQSRAEFTKQQEAEKALTEGRLDEAIASGNEFAQYFKDQLSGKTGTTQLNPYEAALLGVSSGEGLYNLGGDAVKMTQLERGKMISKDEFARQSALANLAKLDQANELKRELKYADESLAGTQSAADALDIAGTRAALNEAETSFRQQAEDANITGSGRGKASKGNWLGTKTRTAQTTIKNNVADMLTAAGYDMNSEVGQKVAKSILSDEQATARFLTGAGKKSTVQSNGVLQGAAMGAGTGATLGSTTGTPVGTALGAAGGALIGAGLNSGNIGEVALFGAASPGLWTDLAADLDQYGIPVVGAVGQGVEDVRNVAGNFVTGIGNIFGGSAGSVIGNLGSSIAGISGSDLQKAAQRKADNAARKDLLKNYKNYLAQAGFSNRIGVSATDKAAVDRLAGLQQLLSRLDKTNVNTVNSPSSEQIQERNMNPSTGTPRASVGRVPTAVERDRMVLNAKDNVKG